MTKAQLSNFIKDEFGVDGDFPFDDFDAMVFRHKANKKWFALVMKVSKRKMKLDSDDCVDILNVKCDTMLKEPLLQKKGIYTAYHMNKTHWISLMLDEAEEEDIKTLLSISFDLTK